MFRKESDYTNYGKGYPGYNWEVRIFMGDQRIARAFGPNVNGTDKGEFRDMEAVKIARNLPDGPIADDVDMLSLLSDYHASQLRSRQALAIVQA